MTNALYDIPLKKIDGSAATLNEHEGKGWKNFTRNFWTRSLPYSAFPPMILVRKNQAPTKKFSNSARPRMT